MLEDQQLARQRFMMSIKVQKAIEVPIAEQLNQRELEKRAEPIEQLLSFLLRDDPAKCVQIGSLLSEEEKGQLLDFLHHNVDILAWSAFDMPRIPPRVIIHKFNIDSKFKLIG